MANLRYLLKDLHTGGLVKSNNLPYLGQNARFELVKDLHESPPHTSLIPPADNDDLAAGVDHGEDSR